jgi:hypothetical protein
MNKQRYKSCCCDVGADDHSLLQRNRNVQVVLESKQVGVIFPIFPFSSVIQSDDRFMGIRQTVETLKLFADIKKNLDGAIIAGRNHKGKGAVDTTVSALAPLPGPLG